MVNLKRVVESSGSKNVLRGAVTNLGKYNEGTLDYVWVPFPCDEDDFDKYLKQVGIGEDRGDGSVYEEWFFSDWNTDYDWVDLSGLGEYEDLDKVNEYADALEDLTGLKVKEQYIYSFALDEEIKL